MNGFIAWIPASIWFGAILCFVGLAFREALRGDRIVGYSRRDATRHYVFGFAWIASAFLLFVAGIEISSYLEARGTFYYNPNARFAGITLFDDRAFALTLLPSDDTLTQGSSSTLFASVRTPIINGACPLSPSDYDLSIDAPAFEHRPAALVTIPAFANETFIVHGTPRPNTVVCMISWSWVLVAKDEGRQVIRVGLARRSQPIYESLAITPNVARRLTWETLTTVAAALLTPLLGLIGIIVQRRNKAPLRKIHVVESA